MSFKIFPFSAGIPWEINKGILNPKIPFNILNNAISDKNIIVTCYGGLLESYLSLSYLEAFNKIWPSKKLTWSGNPIFKDLIEANGLSKFSEEIPGEILSRYPVPLFFDKLNNAIFNPLNNYIKIKPYYGGLKSFNNNNVYLKQIWNNSLLDFKNFYLPLIRNDFDNNNFKNHLLLSKFDFNKPYIIIIPDDLKYSIHSQKCLPWNIQQVKSFATIISQLGYSTVILTDNVYKYYSNNLPFVFEFNFTAFFTLIKNSKMILSNEIDFLLISQLISDNYLVSNKVKKYLDFGKIDYLLKTKSKIKIFKSMNQNDVIGLLNKI